MDYGICVLMNNKVFSSGIKDLTQTNETARIFDRQQLIIFFYNYYYYVTRA